MGRPRLTVLHDGTTIGALLDRNGLRPSRYTLTKDGRVILSSEAGSLPVQPEDVLKKGRLEPGKMFVVDLEAAASSATKSSSSPFACSSRMGPGSKKAK